MTLEETEKFVADAIAKAAASGGDTKTYPVHFVCARAVIKAHTEILMAPSEEMIAAGAEKMDPCWGYSDEKIALEWAAKSFQAMLSAQQVSA